ncbi:MAG TPA: hypothetical protein VFS44_04965 [Gemmatimonadaceae bacterium]|nr:hypothetical protein [Gemmatimonadaceae bacterium]
MTDGDNLPTRPPRLDRAALERVLARAAELQAADADPSDAMLSEDQLLDVGREVGLSPQHVRQALAEERTRSLVPEERGGMARLFGTARVYASRTVRATPEAVFASLDAWMQREETLIVKRRFPDRMLWEPRADFVTHFRRALNVGGHGYHLSRTHEVAATVVPVDEGRVLVRLEADLSNIRLQRVATGGALTGSGALGAATLIALGFFPVVAIAAAGVAAVGGWVVSRSHAPMVARAQLALEQLLDRLERGELPRPSLLAALGATTRMVK